MMTMPHKTVGQQFLEVLNAAKNDKTNMFALLCATLEKNKPPFLEKVDYSAVIGQITGLESVAAVKAAKAGVNARNGAFMFDEDYIYLTAKMYKDCGYGEINDFKRDFKKHTTETSAVQERPMVKTQMAMSHAAVECAG